MQRKIKEDLKLDGLQGTRKYKLHKIKTTFGDKKSSQNIFKNIIRFTKKRVATFVWKMKIK